ncbi:hypothetical protein KY338_03260 [Candidatus Woesearchaeota archaeon]|nr:hypothetical protein [Candidatus Woesearchaeota archaeon]MBW3005378.1 hypothetical protein [Candidatus Woesearchaeota archaeon]
MKINPYLTQDCNITEADLEREDVRICYIARVLTKGTWQDIQDIGLDSIEKYLPIVTIPQDRRDFWEWYFNKGEHSDNKTPEETHCNSI